MDEDEDEPDLINLVHKGLTFAYYYEDIIASNST